MRCLTLSQPWAALVSIGAKRIETRSWTTTYRGPLAIHAAKAFPADAKKFVYESVIRELLRQHFTGIGPLHKQLPLGCVLATCTLLAVIPTNSHLISRISRNEQEDALGNFADGRFAWLLRDIKPLPKPEPARGAPRLWEWNPSQQGLGEEVRARSTSLF